MATANHDDIAQDVVSRHPELIRTGTIPAELRSFVNDVINTTRRMDAAETDSSTDYAVGDVDTTPDTGLYCYETRDGFICTREPKHTGVHAAGTGLTIVEVWEA